MADSVNIPIVVRYIETGADKVTRQLQTMVRTQEQVQSNTIAMSRSLANATSTADAVALGIEGITRALKISLPAIAAVGASLFVFNNAQKFAKDLGTEFDNLDKLTKSLTETNDKYASQRKEIEEIEKRMIAQQQSSFGIIFELFGQKEAQEQAIASAKAALLQKEIRDQIDAARKILAEREKLEQKLAQNARKRYEDSLASERKLQEQRVQLMLDAADKEYSLTQRNLDLKSRQEEAKIKATTKEGPERDLALFESRKASIEAQLAAMQEAMNVRGADKASIAIDIAEKELELQTLITDERDKQLSATTAAASKAQSELEARLKTLEKEKAGLMGEEQGNKLVMGVVASSQRSLGGGGGAFANQSSQENEARRQTGLLTQINREIAKIRATPAYVT